MQRTATRRDAQGSYDRSGSDGEREGASANGPAPPDDLPPTGAVRWVARRKEQVVKAVRNGVLTLEDACARYALSAEEFGTWQVRYDRDGIRGLRARTRHTA